MAVGPGPIPSHAIAILDFTSDLPLGRGRGLIAQGGEANQLS